MMKLFALFLATLLTLSVAQVVVAQGNSEAAKIAREGSQAGKDGDWDKAIDSFQKAAEMDRKYSQNLAAALQQRGAAYMSQQKFPEAAADFSEAIKLAPKDAAIYERRAYTYIKQNDYDKAIADYSEALKLNPNEVRYLSLRSYLYEVKGDIKNSLADTEKILKHDKKNTEALSRKERLLKIQSINSAPPPQVGATPIPHKP
jgi:tetratricopeptide (TPR) repeat protein